MKVLMESITTISAMVALLAVLCSSAHRWVFETFSKSVFDQSEKNIYECLKMFNSQEGAFVNEIILKKSTL